jgi:putative Mg2+ transporter-C (MgtC) family protein
MPLLDVIIRISLALVLGGIIGLEREIREHTAGFRTHILVSVGAAMFTLASVHGLEGTVHDPNRIAAQIVSGIGFLGAGTIIRYGVTIRGLTTAASLWAAAAVGLTCGQGYYSAALVGTTMVIISLYVLRFIESRVLHKRLGTAVGICVRFHSSGYAPLTVLMSAFEEAHILVKDMTVVPGESDADTIHLRLSLPRTITPTALMKMIYSLHEVESVSLD